MELTTPRLHLRPFTLADHDAIHVVYADPEVMRFVGHGAHATMAETTSALRIYGDVLARRGYSFLAVTERATGAIVGDGGLHPLGGTGPDVELGYTLARAAWGKGYATELGRALVEHAFGGPGRRARRRAGGAGEPASRHVLAKLGMTEREERTAYGRPHLLYAVERATRPAAPRGSSPRP